MKNIELIFVLLFVNIISSVGVYFFVQHLSMKVKVVALFLSILIGFIMIIVFGSIAFIALIAIAAPKMRYFFRKDV